MKIINLESFRSEFIAEIFDGEPVETISRSVAMDNAKEYVLMFAVFRLLQCLSVTTTETWETIEPEYLAKMALLEQELTPKQINGIRKYWAKIRGF